MSVMTHRTEEPGPPPARRRAPSRALPPKKPVMAAALVVLGILAIVFAVSWTHAPRRTCRWVTSTLDTITGQASVVSHGSAVVAAGSVKTVTDQVSITGTHRT